MIISVLNKLVLSLNKEEVRHYKLLINRTNTNKNNRKDALLFDYIRKSKDRYNEHKILHEIYGKNDKNAFYRLKNRLKEDIGKSLTLQYFSSSDSNTVLNNIALARHFHEVREFQLATHFLNIAEKKAIYSDSYELLDIIYGDLIKLSHALLTVNPEGYISKRLENRKKLRRLQDIDDILAVLVYRIRVSQNLGKTNDDVVELLQQTINEHTKDKELVKSTVLRFKVYHAVSRILLQQHDYRALEAYLKKTWKDFTKEGLFNRKNHDTKLQLLTYLANSLYKNAKLKESLKFGENLLDAMKQFDGVLYEQYLFYYYNIMVNNYGHVNKSRAIEMLLEARSNKVIKNNPVNLVFILLQLALQYFDTQQYKQAAKSISTLKMSDGFSSLDNGLQLKIDTAELIIRFEQGDHDLLEYLITRVKKDYKSLLKDKTYTRQSRMLEILSEMIYSSNPKDNPNLYKKINQIINEVPIEEAYDTDVLNYNEWLLSKTHA